MAWIPLEIRGDIPEITKQRKISNGMDITFSNNNTIKLSAKSANIVINPTVEVKADLLLYSSPTEQKTDTRAFSGPGEYEVMGCMVDGIPVAESNTAYSLVVDDIHVSYAIDLEGTLTDDQIERMDGVDVLIISVKDDKAELMNKIITQIEPRVLIPLVKDAGELAKIKAEFGKDVEATEKYKVNKKDLPEDSQELVILK